MANVAGESPTGDTLLAAIVTHWVFYSESSNRLADAWVCLFKGSAFTMLPSRVVSIGPDGAEAGSSKDLSGSAGLAIVTAYVADPSCRTTGVLRDKAIVGSYTIRFQGEGLASSSSATGFALDSLGTRTLLLDDSVAASFAGADPNSLIFQSLSPDISGGRVILIGLQEGNGELEPRHEPVTFGVGYFDNFGQQTLLPPLSFRGALFAPLFDDSGGVIGIVPPTVSLPSSGVLVFEKIDPTDDYLTLGIFLNPSGFGAFSTGGIPAVVCPGSGCVGLGPPAGRLEVPVNGGNAAGHGEIAGWVCHVSSGTVDVMIDGSVYSGVIYGGSRPDTVRRCSDEDNGFKAAVDWRNYGEGQHTVEVYVDGYLMDTSTFTVVNTRKPVNDAAGFVGRISTSVRRILNGFTDDRE